MKILHVVPTLDPSAGGPPAVVARLAAAQAGLGHGVSILTHGPREKDRGDTERALKRIPHFDRVDTHWMPPVDWRELVLAPTAARTVGPLLEGREMVHLHGVWERLLAVAARAARARGIPYVLRPCGMLDPWSLRQKPLKKKIALRLGLRRVLNEALFLHVLNADEKEGVARLKLQTPCAVIPNGIFVEEFDPLPAPGTFRGAHPELGERPYVLFLSRLHYKKGLDYLADAFARVAKEHPEAALVVAGPDAGARGPFEARIAAAGIAGRVHLVGPLYGPDKLAALVDAACFCLPSRQEGFSVAITEAMACGLPVVISEACHFPEVRSSGAGEVVTLEAGQVAKALLRVLGDGALRQTMGRMGRELVLARYTWPKIARQTVDAYERRVGSGA